MKWKQGLDLTFDTPVWDVGIPHNNLTAVSNAGTKFIDLKWKKHFPLLVLSLHAYSGWSWFGLRLGARS